jgi:hypothetical protein
MKIVKCKVQNILKGFVKSLKSPLSVIPAQAGIQYFQVVRILWIPVFTGMTTFYDPIILKFLNLQFAINNLQ